jgi:hypothetical protein
MIIANEQLIARVLCQLNVCVANPVLNAKYLAVEHTQYGRMSPSCKTKPASRSFFEAPSLL